MLPDLSQHGKIAFLHLYEYFRLKSRIKDQVRGHSKRIAFSSFQVHIHSEDISMILLIELGKISQSVQAQTQLLDGHGLMPWIYELAGVMNSCKIFNLLSQTSKMFQDRSVPNPNVYVSCNSPKAAIDYNLQSQNGTGESLELTWLTIRSEKLLVMLQEIRVLAFSIFLVPMSTCCEVQIDTHTLQLPENATYPPS